MKRIEAYFKDNDIVGGSFKHYRPAGVLLQPGVVTATPSPDTLNKARPCS